MNLPIRDKVRIPISMKISGITFVLLALMTLVTYTSTQNLKKVRGDLETLSRFYIPLDQTMGNVRTHHLAQILYFERLLARGPHAKSETVRQAAEQAISEAQDCGGNKLSPAATQMRQAFPTPGDQEIAMYELLRFCADKEVATARKMVDDALSKVSETSDGEKFTRLQIELAALPAARDELHATIVKYLAEEQHPNPDSIEILKQQLENNRRLVSRGTGDVLEQLNQYTLETADTARALEQAATLFNWALLSAAATLGALFAAILTRNLVRPVRDLLSGARAIEKGDLNFQVNVSSHDEIALLANSFNFMVSGLKEKEAVKEIFGKYMDPRIVRGLLENQPRAHLGDKRIMTVFFSDIEGFSSICEQLSPDGVVKMLNHYFSVMSAAIQQQQGIIDKYIGDAIMAFWGPPFTSESEHAELACYAALDQLTGLERFRQALPDVIGLRKGLPSFRFRVGICTGDLIVGTIGSEGAKSYTVIGDTVNLASRLETANKHFDTSLIISEGTWAMAKNAIEVRELDYIYVVGKSEPTRAFELLGRRGQTDPARLQLRDEFGKGLQSYRDRDWVAATETFNACLQLCPTDGPAKRFLSRIEYFREHPPAQSWDGVWTLHEK